MSEAGQTADGETELWAVLATYFLYPHIKNAHWQIISNNLYAYKQKKIIILIAHDVVLWLKWRLTLRSYAAYYCLIG